MCSHSEKTRSHRSSSVQPTQQRRKAEESDDIEIARHNKRRATEQDWVEQKDNASLGPTLSKTNSQKVQEAISLTPETHKGVLSEDSKAFLSGWYARRDPFAGTPSTPSRTASGLKSRPVVYFGQLANHVRYVQKLRQERMLREQEPLHSQTEIPLRQSEARPLSPC